MKLNQLVEILKMSYYVNIHLQNMICIKSYIPTNKTFVNQF